MESDAGEKDCEQYDATPWHRRLPIYQGCLRPGAISHISSDLPGNPFSGSTLGDAVKECGRGAAREIWAYGRAQRGREEVRVGQGVFQVNELQAIQGGALLRRGRTNLQISVDQFHNLAGWPPCWGAASKQVRHALRHCPWSKSPDKAISDKIRSPAAGRPKEKRLIKKKGAARAINTGARRNKRGTDKSGQSRNGV